MSKRDLEAEFDRLWTDPRIIPGDRPPFVREHVFHEQRKWRFDFAWPAHRVAVEIDGGTARIGKSRHTSPDGFQNDVDKCNTAIEQGGWFVLRFTSQDLRQRPVQIVELVEAVLMRRERKHEEVT